MTTTRTAKIEARNARVARAIARSEARRAARAAWSSQSFLTRFLRAGLNH